MKKILVVLLVCILTAGCLTGCYSETVDRESEETEELMSASDDAVGYPNISNFYEKKQLKKIYEMRDDPNLICYWYTVNLDGEYIYQGKCIGYGIPYSTSYTQPETTVGSSYEGSVVPQADPNALYSNGVSTSATWILAVDDEGNETPRYVEQEIYVSQTKLAKRLCKKSSLPDNY